jgi:predicted ATPase
LITYRSDEVHPNLAHLLAELDRGHLAVEFSLPCLSQAEAEAMLRAIFSQSRPVRAEFLNVIYSLTAGNPFFIEEVLKALIVSGEIFYVESQGIWNRKPLSELQIPRSIEDTMHRRAEQLSDAARHVLTVAAVAGQRFDFALLQRLAQSYDSDHPERGERELLSIIKELINAQLLIEESDDRFSFRHALTRRAIYSHLLTRERRSLHLLAAQAIEQMYSDSKRLDAHVEELAYHFYEAGVWDKALLYSQRAGAKAQSSYAPRQAVEQFTRAIHAAQQAALEPSLKLYEARGLAYENLADFEQARADYQTMLDGAKARGDQRLEWEAFLALGALWSGRDFERGGDYYQRAQAIANELNDPVAMARTVPPGLSITDWRNLPSERAGMTSVHVTTNEVTLVV